MDFIYLQRENFFIHLLKEKWSANVNLNKFFSPPVCIETDGLFVARRGWVDEKVCWKHGNQMIMDATNASDILQSIVHWECLAAGEQISSRFIQKCLVFLFQIIYYFYALYSIE